MLEKKALTKQDFLKINSFMIEVLMPVYLP